MSNHEAAGALHLLAAEIGPKRDQQFLSFLSAMHNQRSSCVARQGTQPLINLRPWPIEVRVKDRQQRLKSLQICRRIQ